MRRRVLGVAVILMVAGAPQVAFPSDAFCDLDHASLAGRDLALHFVPDSNVFVRVMKAGHAVSWTDQMYQQDGGQMHRLYPNQRAPEPAPSIVFLADDEEAYVGGGAHSSCTIRIGHDGQSLGVNMRANVGLPGLPPQTTTRFLPVR